MAHDSTAGSRVLVGGSERAMPADARDAGPAHPQERTTVSILVRARKPAAEAAAHLATLEPAQRTYLTRDAFAAQHGADPADVLAIQRFALDANLIVLEADLARRTIVVEGTVRELERAFETQLRLYRVGDATFRGRSGTLTVPQSIAALVAGVFGLDERPQARSQFRRLAVPAAGAVSYTPVQVAQAYGFPTSAHAAGQTIALIELGGGYNQSDLDTYFGKLGVAAPAVTSVAVDGASNAPTGSQSGPDSEVVLDIEVAGAVAPGVKIVVYFAPNTDQGFLDAITTAIHDQTNAPSVVSISWGGPESSWTAQATTNFDAAFADAATLGVTVAVAAGDNGSSDGVSDGKNHVDFPASSPHVLACGGTSLQLSGTKIASETVWNDGATGGATGGGVSAVFDLPSYQQGKGVPVVNDAGGKPGRGVPDVAGDADPQTGYSIYVDGAGEVVGGTSAVAPLWAGLVALLNAAAAKPLGFVNTVLYANTGAFNDIVQGNNGAFAAKPGWDACTGLGSPSGAALAKVFGSATAKAGTA